MGRERNLLKPHGEVFEAAGVYRTRGRKGDQDVSLKGGVTWADNSGHQVHLRYGIEKYFIPEGTGGIWEGRREISYLVSIKVAPWGEAKILQITPVAP
ncbi:MAG: GDYXXLXY domain-containing protein [Thermicanus sp.]|nr:GDYXXLXY domain-containing protein [Thermicanus sp.]